MTLESSENYFWPAKKIFMSCNQQCFQGHINFDIMGENGIIRADYDGKWSETVTDIWRALGEVSIPSIRNTDISPKMLNDKGRFPGLHLNKWGRARLAMNFLSFLRKC